MNPSVRSFLFFVALITAGASSTELAAQSGSCLFSFEPEYMGVGNCFRVILRNDDPTRAPEWVGFMPLQNEVLIAGNVDPSKVHEPLDERTWRFRNYEALPAGTPDTAYICFISSVPTARVAIAWGRNTAGILCRDTVEIGLPHVSNHCMEVEQLDLVCGALSKQRSGPGARPASGSVVNDRPVLIALDFTLRNPGEREVGSVEVTGPGCDVERVTFESRRFVDPVDSGDYFDVDVPPFQPVCFQVDSAIGWRVDSLELVYYDSSDVALCADTIHFIINGIACNSSSVAESGSGTGSAINLRIAMSESDEASVSFTLEKRTNVRLSLIDMRGNEVLRLLDDETREGGENRVALNTTGISTGSYICLLQAGEKSVGRVVQIVR